MRKIKSLALIALTSFAIAACSSVNKEVEQASVDDLYAKGAAALQEGSYSCLLYTSINSIARKPTSVNTIV